MSANKPQTECERLATALYRAHKDGCSLDNLLPGLGVMVARAQAILPGKKPFTAMEMVVSLLDLYALDQTMEGR
jgi:hypothetical protein